MAQPTGRVTLYDGDGEIITTLELDETGSATYSEVMGENDIGYKTVRAVYTGDLDYRARDEDEITLSVADENGEVPTNNKATKVVQIVAGPGIYISPDDGKGVVTISTEPIDTSDVNGEIWDVHFTESYGLPGFEGLRQFTAVGTGGINLRSRDGINWVKMGAAVGTSIFGVSTELSPSIPDNHVEYNGVGDTKSIYGREGSTSTVGMSKVTTLTAQNSGVCGLLSTFAFHNGGSYSASNPSPGSGDWDGEFTALCGIDGTGTTATLVLRFTDNIDVYGTGAEFTITPKPGPVITLQNAYDAYNLSTDIEYYGEKNGVPFTPEQWYDNGFRNSLNASVDLYVNDHYVKTDEIDFYSAIRSTGTTGSGTAYVFQYGGALIDSGQNTGFIPPWLPGGSYYPGTWNLRWELKIGPTVKDTLTYTLTVIQG